MNNFDWKDIAKVGELTRKYTLDELWSIAEREENNLALAIHNKMQEEVNEKQREIDENASQQSDYDNGWNDALEEAISELRMLKN